jgi:uncharacterized protein (DUF2141 family)
MKAFLGSLALLLVAPTLFGAQLTVTVTGLGEPGEIHLAIYESAAAFEGDRGDRGGPQAGIITGSIEPAGPEDFTATFELPDGTYAVGVFHDVDGNEALSKNFLGIPKEPFGFSNNVRGRFGPPSFMEASFSLTRDLAITIALD